MKTHGFWRVLYPLQQVGGSFRSWHAGKLWQKSHGMHGAMVVERGLVGKMWKDGIWC
jgi:hypothetical protein